MSDRDELQRRLDQVRRVLAAGVDIVTTARLTELARDIEEQLRLSK